MAETRQPPAGDPPREQGMHHARGIHEAAVEEQHMLGREVDHDVDPDEHASWRVGIDEALKKPEEE